MFVINESGKSAHPKSSKVKNDRKKDTETSLKKSLISKPISLVLKFLERKKKVECIGDFSLKVSEISGTQSKMSSIKYLTINSSAVNDGFLDFRPDLPEKYKDSDYSDYFLHDTGKIASKVTIKKYEKTQMLENQKVEARPQNQKLIRRKFPLDINTKKDVISTSKKTPASIKDVSKNSDSSVYSKKSYHLIDPEKSRYTKSLPRTPRKSKSLHDAGIKALNISINSDLYDSEFSKVIKKVDSDLLKHNILESESRKGCFEGARNINIEKIHQNSTIFSKPSCEVTQKKRFARVYDEKSILPTRTIDSKITSQTISNVAEDPRRSDLRILKQRKTPLKHLKPRMSQGILFSEEESKFKAKRQPNFRFMGSSVKISSLRSQNPPIKISPLTKNDNQQSTEKSNDSNISNSISTELELELDKQSSICSKVLSKSSKLQRNKFKNVPDFSRLGFRIYSKRRRIRNMSDRARLARKNISAKNTNCIFSNASSNQSQNDLIREAKACFYQDKTALVNVDISRALPSGDSFCYRTNNFGLESRPIPLWIKNSDSTNFSDSISTLMEKRLPSQKDHLIKEVQVLQSSLSQSSNPLEKQNSKFESIPIAIKMKTKMTKDLICNKLSQFNSSNLFSYKELGQGCKTELNYSSTRKINQKKLKYTKSSYSFKGIRSRREIHESEEVFSSDDESLASLYFRVSKVPGFFGAPTKNPVTKSKLDVRESGGDAIDNKVQLKDNIAQESQLDTENENSLEDTHVEGDQIKREMEGCAFKPNKKSDIDDSQIPCLDNESADINFSDSIPLGEIQKQLLSSRKRYEDEIYRDYRPFSTNSYFDFYNNRKEVISNLSMRSNISSRNSDFSHVNMAVYKIPAKAKSFCYDYRNSDLASIRSSDAASISSYASRKRYSFYDTLAMNAKREKSKILGEKKDLLHMFETRRLINRQSIMFINSINNEVSNSHGKRIPLTDLIPDKKKTKNYNIVTNPIANPDNQDQFSPVPISMGHRSVSSQSMVSYASRSSTTQSRQSLHSQASWYNTTLPPRPSTASAASFRPQTSYFDYPQTQRYMPGVFGYIHSYPENHYYNNELNGTDSRLEFHRLPKSKSMNFDVRGSYRLYNYDSLVNYSIRHYEKDPRIIIPPVPINSEIYQKLKK
ncbi:hypothetical protein AYI68_g894 [Smittium mucronatum]|uniref:Uncharacterized protein n=1 Tax=Smittium mucronatum TaxID=133383 RepID=A0A1R0H716_9FUNG|nr:hypothetical protein AYI68_g894 [Smittium mucronatum]